MLTLRGFPGGPVAGRPTGLWVGRGREIKTSADRTAEPVCSGAGALATRGACEPTIGESLRSQSKQTDKQHSVEALEEC